MRSKINGWKDIWKERPPYFELVQVQWKERDAGNEYSHTPFGHAALIPGKVFDDYHEDFWIDESLIEEFLQNDDVSHWKLIKCQWGKPRVKFVQHENGLTYEFKFMWTPDQEPNEEEK